MPRVVLGFPMYRSEELVSATLDSLLTLEFDDYAVVAIDDASPDGTFDVARRRAETDPRLVVEANPRRLGMIRNWNRVLQRAYELFPDFEYFAWASDNDFRDPTWLPKLVQALEAEPNAAIAYSKFGLIKGGTREAPTNRWLFESTTVADRIERLQKTTEGLRAGPMMYGLHRRSTLERAGNVPEVLLSDVLFLCHLSLYGTFVQIPEVLWYRGARTTGGRRKRQRAALFADPPATTYLPVPLQHVLWLFRTLVVEGRLPPGLGRGEAVHVPEVYLKSWVRRLVGRGEKAYRKFVKRRQRDLRRRARPLRPVVRRARALARRVGA